jgi:phosphatidylserine/phosphatidylglycerophosphate/cardiolipin synthase-like enzyme
MNESVINFVKVKLLERFDQSWAERLRALRSAKKRIVFEPHYLAMDPIGLRLLSEMLRARQRHPELQIDLLLDFWACRHITPELATLLSARGFRIRYFNCPFFKRISRVNLRSHRKILVIDDEVFIGGLNSSEEFLSQASAKNFMDREVILSGDFAELSAQAIYELGNSSWSSDASEIRWWNFPWLGRQSQRKEAAQILRQIEKVGFEKIQIATASLSLRVEKKNISLVFDHVKGPRSRRERTQTSREFLKLFRETKTRLVWETLFFIVPGCVQRILDHKLKRGLTAQVLTNGRASLGGDFGAAMSLTAFYFQKYLAQGISFFGMKNPSVATQRLLYLIIMFLWEV